MLSPAPHRDAVRSATARLNAARLYGSARHRNGELMISSWLALAGAIVLEVSGTISMKLSDGFTRPVPSVLIFVFYSASFVALTLALKKIDVSVAYAIWAGVGTALISIVGILYFKEPWSTLKVFSIFLIIAGVIGLNLSGAKQ
jgi:small multidrug resistance pump